MLIHGLMLGAAVAAFQAPPMPPPPDELKLRVAAVPRCAPPIVAAVRRAGDPKPETLADRILDGMRRAQEQFPNIRCQEGSGR